MVKYVVPPESSKYQEDILTSSDEVLIISIDWGSGSIKTSLSLISAKTE